MFEEELLLANLSVQEKYLQVSFWDFTYKELDAIEEDKNTESEEVIVAFNLADKKYNFDIDTKLLAKTQHPTNSLILASKANDKIAQLSIDHRTGFSLKVIIEMPAKVKRINSISSQDKDRFILINVNNGQLWVYAKLNDGSYGLIYDLLLPSKYSMMAMTEGLLLAAVHEARPVLPQDGRPASPEEVRRLVLPQRRNRGSGPQRLH
jgi:hypothetical protein